MSAAQPNNLEICRRALNLAQNCGGYAVLPCSADEQPLIPIRNASKLSSTIRSACMRTPGPLIGIATGTVSGIWVLAICSEASNWWRVNHSCVLATRTFRSRLGWSTGKLALGGDVRGDGGYVVSWFAARLVCLDHIPPAPWPRRLLAELLLKLRPALPPSGPVRDSRGGLLPWIVSGTEGERSNVLYWAACREGERVAAGQLGMPEAEELLVAAAGPLA
jgi:hypothetical protein